MVPIDSSLCFSTIGMTAAAPVIDAVVAALEAQQLQVEQYYAELGHGQHELSISPRPALAAADAQLLVRETIRGVAAQHGVVASLAAKPWPDQAGNGAHVHFSLWHGESNSFTILMGGSGSRMRPSPSWPASLPICRACWA